jgi:hypothetical protein
MANEVRRLTKALAFAAEAHRNHRRKGASQEPYINHLIEVVDLVASVEGCDMDVLIAALLHDTLEDTRTGYDKLVATFGERVARVLFLRLRSGMGWFNRLRGSLFKFCSGKKCSVQRFWLERRRDWVLGVRQMQPPVADELERCPERTVGADFVVKVF